jgi:hypothetical protein
MTEHEKYHYSITVQTTDLAVLHCLRGLVQFSEETSKKMIAWGNTGEPDWRNNNNCVTFHFSQPAFRETFIYESNRLLPNMWTEKSRRNDDPARRAT